MSDHTPGPGLAQQAQLRTFFRIVGPILAVVGAVISIYGFYSFMTFGDDLDFEGVPAKEMALFMGGFIVFAIGMGMTRAGYGSIAARYASGELSPVLKDSLQHVGLTRPESPEQSGATGPYCRQCGVRALTADSRFCSGCGAELG